MRTIVLNTQNLVQNGQNNTLIYNFPNSVQFKDCSISVASISLYYSWFNIRSDYNNNTFTYNWTVGSTTTTYTITIPDGLYEISDLNSFLQYNFIQNGHYLINSFNQNVYYAEFILNVTRYAVQINTYLLPTTLPSGYSQPSNWAGYPTTSYNPSITIPSKLNIILGFTANLTTNDNTNNAYTPPTSNYISKNSSGTLSYLSTVSPNIQPNSSLYVCCTNINNQYSSNSSIIYSINTNGAGVGSIILEKPPNYVWNKLINGTYNNLTITLIGSYDNQPIILNDPSITIMLVIKDDAEQSTK